MTHTAPTQPLCRWCAKPISKTLRRVWLRKSTDIQFSQSTFSRCVAIDGEWPKNKNECARLTNQTITSVSKSHDGEVQSFNEWDGETYENEFFCTNTCAINMGFAAVGEKHGMSTKRYRDAIAKRTETASAA